MYLYINNAKPVQVLFFIFEFFLNIKHSFTNYIKKLGSIMMQEVVLAVLQQCQIVSYAPQMLVVHNVKYLPILNQIIQHV